MKTLKKYVMVWMWILISGINIWAGVINVDSWMCLFSFFVAVLCLYWAWGAKKEADRHEKRMAEIQALIDQYSR